MASLILELKVSLDALRGKRNIAERAVDETEEQVRAPLAGVMRDVCNR